MWPYLFEGPNSREFSFRIVVVLIDGVVGSGIELGVCMHFNSYD